MEDKNSLKASVPVEFRKWTKWYLARHFGKKEAPKFRKHGGCQRKMEEKMAKHKKAWKKGCKQHTLSTSIPMMHRMWVKIFINDWRQEHNIPDPKLTSHVTVSSESEDTEKVKGDITVPNDYVRWLRKYLARWHLWRGEIEKVEIEKGGMAEFKDTIPKGLCKWVKYYLWQRYGNGTTKEADTACQYQKWLQAFQRKWLREQVKGGSADDLILTSSEDEAPNRPINVDEAETTVESLKKLRLEGDEDGTKKVRFNPSTEGRDSDKTAPRNIGDFDLHCFMQI
uniref:Uncharacterized protein n=1 Tax=Arion vulgaris TaxID=1028688 RepID=A0A0B7BH23_9EUPU